MRSATSSMPTDSLIRSTGTSTENVADACIIRPRTFGCLLRPYYMYQRDALGSHLNDLGW